MVPSASGWASWLERNFWPGQANKLVLSSEYTRRGVQELGGSMVFGKKSSCQVCGQSLAAHDRDVRFRLPEPVLSSPEQHRAEGSWLSDAEPAKATLMQIPNLSPFVRALLPIKLQGGHEFRFGVWIAIHPNDLQRACKVWNAPEYSDLRLTGYLANRIQPWGLYKVPVNLAV
ncbi:DUF2199 domain-containing protein [Arthrobacter phoenicis]